MLQFQYRIKKLFQIISVIAIIFLLNKTNISNAQSPENTRLIVPTKDGSSDPNKGNVIRAESSIQVQQIDDYYELQLNKGDRVALAGNSTMCQQFHELIFTTKNQIKGRIRIRELQENNKEKIPVKNKDSIVFNTCSISLEGIKSEDIGDISLSTTYPQNFIDTYGITDDELKYFISFDFTSNLNRQLDTKRVDEVTLNGNKYEVFQTQLPQLPINFVLAPGDTIVLLEVANEPTQSKILQSSGVDKYGTQVAKLVIAGFVLSLGSFIIWRFLSRPIEITPQRMQFPRRKKKATFW